MLGRNKNFRKVVLTNWGGIIKSDMNNFNNLLYLEHILLKGVFCVPQSVQKVRTAKLHKA